MTFIFHVWGKAGEDLAELVEHVGEFLRAHEDSGIQGASFSSEQFSGDPRDVAALDADPNAPVEATPAVAEPGDDGPATDDDVAHENIRDEHTIVVGGPAETRDDVPAPRPPGPLS